MLKPDHLYQSPNELATHYARFRVADRLLLTGHSHQCWPDRGFDGQKQAWLDAAEFVDDKWTRAFDKADRVRQGFAHLLGDRDGHYALASNTHDLVIRFLSALPLGKRPRLVTTDGEYHSIRRQLDRISEEGVEVAKVAAYPAASVAERLADAVDERTSAVLASAVFYQRAHIVPGLGTVSDACQRVGAELLVDAYHAINVVPFLLERERLGRAFIVGGGYKYCQLGEGNCFLRFPADCAMRPVITGWFSEFSALAQAADGNQVVYGQGVDRFAGSTYDPTSHYRAAAVLDFFEEKQLTPELLREVSRHQISVLAERFDALDADPAVVSRPGDVALENVAGFLALSSPVAGKLCDGLREHGVFADYRGNMLRLGPAPYLSDGQLIEAVTILGDVTKRV